MNDDMSGNSGDGLRREGVLFAQAIGVGKAHRVGNRAPEIVAVMDRGCEHGTGPAGHRPPRFARRRTPHGTYNRLNAVSVALSVDEGRFGRAPATPAIAMAPIP